MSINEFTPEEHRDIMAMVNAVEDSIDEAKFSGGQIFALLVLLAARNAEMYQMITGDSVEAFAEALKDSIVATYQANQRGEVSDAD